ncbi:MAG: YggU family protein [Acidimicrobiia bacterium]
MCQKRRGISLASLEELLEETETGIAFYVHVQPAAGKTKVLGRHGDALKISVAAPPVGGRANDALVQFLSKTLGVGLSSVKIISGHSARKKRVAVEGTDRSMAAKLLESVLHRAGSSRK